MEAADRNVGTGTGFDHDGVPGHAIASVLS